ncbi:MAG: antibiotic biosynthesis monooxygenase [Gammaproteobacteria bacterium]|nr:antibiotic biosynthesis monooxygenase [Gammaproteobacteria bacterium]
MIKVIIERNIAEGLELNYLDAIRATLHAVMEAPGYISSESLTDVHKTNHRLIITNWRSVQAWEKWHSSPERKAAIAEIAPILDGDEKITVTEAR